MATRDKLSLTPFAQALEIPRSLFLYPPSLHPPLSCLPSLLCEGRCLDRPAMEKRVAPAAERVTNAPSRAGLSPRKALGPCVTYLVLALPPPFGGSGRVKAERGHVISCAETGRRDHGAREDPKPPRGGAPRGAATPPLSKTIGAAIGAPPPPHQEGKSFTQKPGAARRGKEKPCPQDT